MGCYRLRDKLIPRGAEVPQRNVEKTFSARGSQEASGKIFIAAALCCLPFPRSSAPLCSLPFPHSSAALDRPRKMSARERTTHQFAHRVVPDALPRSHLLKKLAVASHQLGDRITRNIEQKMKTSYTGIPERAQIL